MQQQTINSTICLNYDQKNCEISLNYVTEIETYKGVRETKCGPDIRIVHAESNRSNKKKK